MLKNKFKNLVKFIVVLSLISNSMIITNFSEALSNINHTINLKASCCNKYDVKNLKSGVDVYLSHNLLVKGAEDAEEAKKLVDAVVTKTISLLSTFGIISIPYGLGFLVGPLFSWISKMTMKTKVEQWKDLSANNNNCGVVLLYDIEKTGDNPVKYNLKYYGILPQTEASCY